MRGLTVLLTGELAGTLNELRAVAPDARIEYIKDRLVFESRIGEAEVLAGPISPEGLQRATQLKWAHSWMAGPNPQLFPAFVEHPVVLTCSKGNGAVPLAEHAMMLMLMLNRNAMRWIAAHRERRWEPFYHGELNGLTVGIIGAGYSGQDLALKAKAFHMRVLGVRRHKQPTPNFDVMYAQEDLGKLLAEADFVVMTAPKTQQSAGMLGEAEFRAMKRSAYYVCFSRGGVADNAALLKALSQGWIAGAGLDAHGEEPLPPHSPFWTLPNCIITPHNGATTAATRRRGFEIFAQNLGRYVRGEPLVNVVDKHLGY